MRRFTVLALGLAAVMLSACSPGNDRVEPYLLEEWFYRWEQSGYPDDVAGVYFDSEQGVYVLMLTDGTDIRAYERSLTGEYRIETAAYAMRELQAVQRGVEERMQTGPDAALIYSVGIGWTTVEGQLTGFGAGGKEFRVVVAVDAAVRERIGAEFAGLYGDMVAVEEGHPVELDG